VPDDCIKITQNGDAFKFDPEKETMKKNLLISLLGSSLLIMLSCIERLAVESPDGNNNIRLELNENGTLFYRIQSHGVKVIDKSLMGMEIDSTLDFNSGLRFVNFSKTLIDETYHLPTGKTSVYHNKANETLFTFKNHNDQVLKVICRAYDDGVAFRYVIERQGEITIKKENTRFSLPQNTLCWMMNYIPNYENFYPKRLLDTIGNKALSYPALMRVKDKLWMLITEASVYDQPVTHIRKTGNGNELEVELPEYQYTVASKWESPWRTFILGTNLATIVESVLVENLNPPSQTNDMSWIEPGPAVFPWWGNYMANSYIDTLKRYVDLAAEMHWKWIEFDVSLVGSPLRTSKLWETTQWLPEFTAYARSKGINVYGWDEINVLNTPEGRDHVFGRYQELGIRGIKMDYIDSDKQYAMRFRRDAMKDALGRKMMVSFHGETMPHGQRRTFPNVMTLEGVRGAEYYTFRVKGPTPEHNCTLPFTRNVVGPMDYTPVTFTICPENPRKTTYAHELALAIIFESGWMVMADRPDAYLKSPAKEFLQKLETSWDETRFIEGYPGEYICLARRKGSKWFIAGINAAKERKIEFPLNFISTGDHNIKIYEDKPGEEMTNLLIRNETVNPRNSLIINMMPNGGFSTLIE
jgi:alpha-glucosidase